MSRVALVLICVLVVASAAAAGPPSWVRKPPRDTTRMLYAVGVASGEETVEAGRQAAVAGALGADLEARAAGQSGAKLPDVRKGPFGAGEKLTPYSDVTSA